MSNHTVTNSNTHEDSTTMPDGVTDTVEELVGTLEDGRKGFEQAADKLAGDGHAVVADRLRTFAAQRKEFSAELRRVASGQGLSGDLDASGTTAGALHRGWIGLKDALTGNDAEAVLTAVRSGEEHAVSEYEDAIEDLTGDIAATARRQADEIRNVRDEVTSLTLV